MKKILKRKKGGRLSIACDSCSIAKKRCDEKIPCSRCFRLGKSCTRLRKKDKTVSKCLNILDESNVDVYRANETCKGLKMISVTNLQLVKKYELIPLIRSTGIVDLFGSPLAIFPLKVLHMPHLMDRSDLQLYKISPNVYLQLLLKELASDKLIHKKAITEPIQLDFNNEICYNALLYYFKYINVFLPLFTLHQFISRKRSKSLISSIILVGLAHSSKTQEGKRLALNIRNYLNDILVPGSFPKSLEDIQIGLILVNGLSNHEYSLAQVRFSMLKRASIAMGLHLNFESKKYNHNYLIERKLCYSALIYMESFNCTLPLETKEEGYLWSGKLNASRIYKKRISKELDMQKDRVESTILLCTMTILSEFYYVLGSFIPYIYSFLKNLLIINVTNFKLLTVLRWCDALSSKIFKKSMDLLDQLCQNKNTNKELLEYINIIKNGIQIIYYGINIGINDLACIANDDNKDSIFNVKPLNKLQLDPSQLIKNLEPFLVSITQIPSYYLMTFQPYFFIIAIKSVNIFSKRYRSLKPWLVVLNHQLDVSIPKEFTYSVHKLIDRISNNAIHSFEYMSKSV